MPNWEKYLDGQVAEKAIHINYFTEKTFQNPEKKIGIYITRDLKKFAEASNRIQVAELYFLQKNMGIKLDLKQIEADLNTRRMPRTSAGKPEEIIPGALKLLQKKGKITLKEAREFIIEFGGSGL